MANESGTIYICSTLSASVVYEIEGGKEIFIAGGANIPDKHFLTPQGVMTSVTAEDLAALKKTRVFALHASNGFLTWSDKKSDVEAIVSGMQGADDSAPDTEADAEVVEQKSGTKTRAKKEA
jgi:hypothetical protein